MNKKRDVAQEEADAARNELLQKAKVTAQRIQERIRKVLVKYRKNLPPPHQTPPSP